MTKSFHTCVECGKSTERYDRKCDVCHKKNCPVCDFLGEREKREEESLY